MVQQALEHRGRAGGGQLQLERNAAFEMGMLSVLPSTRTLFVTRCVDQMNAGDGGEDRLRGRLEHGLAAVEEQVVGEHAHDEAALVDRGLDLLLQPVRGRPLVEPVLEAWRFSRVGSLGGLELGESPSRSGRR